MASMMRTHETAGVTAAAARVMSLASMATRPASPIETSTIELGLGYGWQSVVASPCDHADFTKAINTNKRQPRRLGQRTT